MTGQKKRKFNDEPENQTSGIILNANIFNTKNYLKSKTKKNSLFFRFDRCKKAKLPVLR